jgi:hypothetical protein
MRGEFALEFALEFSGIMVKAFGTPDSRRRS